MEVFLNKKEKWLKRGGFLFLLALFLFFLAEKINLTTADLGRHLANGELLLSGENFWKILKTNFYSYTYPAFPFINHHWLSGVVFFLVWKVFGFQGTHLFFLLISGLTFAVFFFLAQKKGGYFWAVAFSLILLPLLAERREVRPEIFSYLFAGCFFGILWNCRQKIFSSRWLWLLPVLQLIWVNLHVAFFLGFLILGIFLFSALLEKNFSFAKGLGLLLGVNFLVTLINPNGLSGAIYPGRIFENFGYALAENKSIFFLENFGMQNPNFILLKLVILLLWGSFVWIFWKKREFFSWADFFLGGLFSLMALAALRNMSSAAFFFLPILAGNFRAIFSQRIRFDPAVLFATFLGYLGLIFLVYYQTFFSVSANRGLGLLENNNRAADFFREQKISGPIFNNYDLGGYLIFHFKNQEKVFVDNRPEAYPEKFFQEEYIPMQEDSQRWNELEKKYAFNVVFFYRHDLTPWGQNFLVSLVDNSNWVPVFVDDYCIIFLKDNQTNRTTIEKFRLPREMFGVKH